MGYLLFIEIYGVRTVLESVDALVSHMGGTKGRKDNAGSYLSVQIVHRDLYIRFRTISPPPLQEIIFSLLRYANVLSSSTFPALISVPLVHILPLKL
jgi:hypothetical protein